MESAEPEVEKNDELQYLKDRTLILDSSARKKELILQAGAFRELLPRNMWKDRSQPEWSDRYHVASIEGQVITDTRGIRHRLRYSLPVKEEK